MSLTPDLVSLPLTLVYYDPNSPFGLISAFLALVPLALIVGYVVAIYERREIRTCHAFSGQLACEALNFVLKRVIKQHRPHYIIGLGKGYGMPSSHSQFMGYFAAYVIMTLASGRHHGHLRSRILRGLSAILAAIGVCASRVYLAYHTEQQVYIGVSIGFMFGVFWYYVFKALVAQGVIDVLLDLPLSRFFYLKNTNVRNKLSLEWQEWQRTRRKRD